MWTLLYTTQNWEIGIWRIWLNIGSVSSVPKESCRKEWKIHRSPWTHWKRLRKICCSVSSFGTWLMIFCVLILISVFYEVRTWKTLHILLMKYWQQEVERFRYGFVWLCARNIPLSSNRDACHLEKSCCVLDN